MNGPFGEHTVIRSGPGERAGEASPGPYAGPLPGLTQTAPPQQPDAADQGGGAVLDATPALNPLVDAAAPILILLSRLSAILPYYDVQGLRHKLLGAFAVFDKQADTAGIRQEIRRASHYALCATVDDIAANTPWSGQNVWAGQSMARVFHKDLSGGERFFHLLTHFERDPETYGDVLELFYFCLSLGFQGRFALLPEGAAEIAAIRGRLHRLIRRRRGEIAAELSPHWRGVLAPHRRFASRIPLWAVAACTAALLLLAFLGFLFTLSGSSDGLLAELATVPKVAQPRLQTVAARISPPPAAPSRVAGFLEPEIREGLVTVRESPQDVMVRLRGTGLFGAGSATLEARFLPVIDRIAAALKDEPGQAMVVGHTDNKPIRTLEFPSNYELSLARAKTVRDRLARGLGSAERISVAGRADAEPLADNATPQGRETNRRIEIIVLRGRRSP